MRVIAVWAWAIVALLAAHDVTHLVDDGLATRPGQLAIVAIPLWLLVAALMAVILRGDRARSRRAALLLGGGVTAGFAVVHLLPLTPAAFWELEPSVASWVLAWVPAAAGLGLLLALHEPRPVGGRRDEEGQAEAAHDAHGQRAHP